MSRPDRRHRAGEAGLLRRLVSTLLLLVVLVVGVTGWVLVKAMQEPDLGAMPGGVSHGSTQTEVSLAAVAALAPVLLPGHPHGTFTLSEHDLTVVLSARVHAADFRDPQARIRGGLLVVSGHTTLGPVGVTGVGRVGLQIVAGADGLPDVAAEVQEIDAGTLTLPGLVRDAIADRVRTVVNLGDLLASQPQLRTLRADLECVAIHPDGVVLGFHTPGLAPDPSVCG